jgi:hypothetical protein
MSIGQDEDDRAFEEMMSGKCWKPKSGADLQFTMEQMAKMNPRLALGYAWAAGMERGLSKRGCCSENPGANPGCCPDSVGRDAN